MSLRTSGWKLTIHSGTSRSAVSFWFGRFVQGSKEIPGIDKLGFGICHAARDLAVVDWALACRDEELADGGAECVCDSLHDFDSDISHGSFDTRDRGP